MYHRRGKMQVNSSAGQILDEVETSSSNTKADENILRILGQKALLAPILKESIAELKDFSNEEIIDFIEGDVKIRSESVRPYGKNHIDGMSQVSHVTGEGTVRFDIRFRLNLPQDVNGKYRQVIVNVEAQNRSNPGYSLAKRGLYYMSRMISEQLESLADPRAYDSLEKVYSIWLITDTDNKVLEADTITEYRMGQHNLYGNMRKRVEYDMLSMIFICLGKDSENLMIRAFHDLIDDEVIFENKRKSLEDVGVRMSREIEVGVQSMCNITERYIEKGMKKGLEEGKEIGLEEGMEKGKEIGLEEGKEIGLEEGMEIGLERGSITSAINIYRTELGLGDQEIKGRIMDKFGLDSTEAERYIAMAE